MKKNLLFSASMLACLTFMMAGCQNGNDVKPGGNTVDPDNPTKTNTVSFEAAYDASVLSGIGLLNSGVSTNTLRGYKVSLMAEKADESTNKDSKPEENKDAKPDENKETKPEENKETKPDENKETKPDENKTNGLDKLNEGLKKEILDNLSIANSTLNGDSAKSEIKKSDRPEWEEMYTITQKDLSGEDIVYTFYYTETLGDEEAEALLASDTSSDLDNTEATNEEDEEIEKHIKGIVVALDKEFEVSGDREIEADEESVTYKIMLDKDNYVVIENEVEGTENEYEYSKYENGKRVFKSEVEYEVNEDGEVEIEFETKTPEDGKVKFKYEFVNENGESLIKVQIKKAKNNIKSMAVIRVALNENEEASYEFIDYIEKK